MHIVKCQWRVVLHVLHEVHRVLYPKAQINGIKKKKTLGGLSIDLGWNN